MLRRAPLIAITLGLAACGRGNVEPLGPGLGGLVQDGLRAAAKGLSGGGQGHGPGIAHQQRDR